MAALLTAACLVSSCDQQVVYEQYKAVKSPGWEHHKPVVFEVQITDTVTPHHVYFNIRNLGSYEFSNLFVFLTSHFPNGKTGRDTLEFILADQSGKWLGKGVGDLYDRRHLFISGYRFPAGGVYRFELDQGMRENPLKGISDVGIRIEKTPANK